MLKLVLLIQMKLRVRPYVKLQMRYQVRRGLTLSASAMAMLFHCYEIKGQQR